MFWQVMGLVALDQGVKHFMNTFFRDLDVRVFDNNLLGLEVYLNQDVSIFNGEFLNMDLSMGLLTLLNLVLLLVLVSVYQYLQLIHLTKKSVYLALLFFLSATVCSTIDRVFWGGSLDFIVFMGWIIDFKDIYLGLGAIIVLISVIKEHDSFKSSKEDFESVKNYFRFVKESVSKRFSR